MCLSECEHPQSNVNVYNVGNGHCGAERFIFKIFLVYYVTVYTHRTLRIRHEIGYCVRKPTGDDEDEPLSAGNNYRIDGKYEQITVAGEQKFTTTKNFLFVPFPPQHTKDSISISVNAFIRTVPHKQLRTLQVLMSQT